MAKAGDRKNFCLKSKDYIWAASSPTSKLRVEPRSSASSPPGTLLPLMVVVSLNSAEIIQLHVSSLSIYLWPLVRSFGPWFLSTYLPPSYLRYMWGISRKRYCGPSRKNRSISSARKNVIYGRTSSGCTPSTCASSPLHPLHDLVVPPCLPAGNILYPIRPSSLLSFRFVSNTNH